MLFFCVLYSYAEKVTLEKAEKVARSYARTVPQLKSRNNIRLSHTVSKELKQGNSLRAAQEEAMYYVFSMDSDGGFIIVSADDVATPVLGYSEDGSYDAGNPNLSYWLDCLAQEIAQGIENNIPQSAEIKAKWDAYLNGSTSTLRASTAVVNPLVQTRWDQADPYNALCPSGTVTGCVATAMAQIMKYWNYPEMGTGSHSYTDPTYGTQSANFDTTYNWANMTNIYSPLSTQDQNSAVATLMYHCGVSVDMAYATAGEGGSGAYSEDVVTALAKYFKYDAGVNIIYRSFYSSADWVNIIKTELEESRPVLYSGQGTGGGHAFVCDGYDSNNLFHFNWGWSGSSDGYFELSALNPWSLGIGGGAGGFNSYQTIIIGIKPNENSPLLSLTVSSISASVPSLTTPTQPFNINVESFFNLGSYIDTLNIGLLLCQLDNTPVNYQKDTAVLNLDHYYGWSYHSDFYTDYSLPSPLPAGTYKLYLAFSTLTDPDTPTIIPGNNGNNFLLVQVNGDGTVLLSSGGAPNLSLESLTTEGNLYNGMIGSFWATVTNNGPVDYTSQLTIKINGKAIGTEPVVIPAGTTKDIGFSDTIHISSGTYPLTLWYDPNNNQSTPSVQLGSPVDVTVLQPDPINNPPKLSATLSFPDPQAFVSATQPNLSVSVKNTGGIFQGTLIAYIFLQGQVYSIGAFGSKIVSLEQGQTTTFVFNDPVTLPEGQYITNIYNYNSKSWIATNLQFTLVYSSDATLSNLTVDQGTLSPAFSANTTNYTINVDNSITAVTLTGTANNGFATVFGNGTNPLNVGKNTFTIEVTAENATTKMQYNVTVNRAGTLTWMPLSPSTDWNDPNNWTPHGIPAANTKIIIPAGASYPILTATAAVDTIQFLPGAELGRQDYLTYNKAFVALDFRATGGLARKQWHLLSMPIDKVVTGDFSFGGYPYTYVRKFIITDDGDTYQQAGWESFSTTIEPLPIGGGFALWVNDGSPQTKGYNDNGSGIDALISPNVRNYGLGKVNGTIVFPYFEDQATSDAHRTHKYENGASIFYPINTSTTDLSLIDNPSSYARGDDAYRLAPASSMPIPVNFGQDGTGYFALVGNPFMSTIDFQAFCTANTDIKNSYQIWTGSGFSAYGYNGESGVVSDGVTLTQYIAPMQSFFVEKSSAYSGTGTLNFNLADISASGNPAVLRSSSSVEDQSIDKLNITASNDKYKVLTYITKREQGSDKFSNADSRKIIPGMSDVPEIYTLKDSEKGNIAVGSNIVNSDVFVPLGLATAYEGKLLFTFSGMDKYDSRITFIDLSADKEIDLTDMPTYEYSFNYVPKKAGDEIKAEEDRFFIRIKKSGAGIETIEDMANVYANKNTIYAVSSPSNLIRQMEVYNLQGSLLYSGKNLNAAHYTVTLNAVSPEICLVRLVTEQGVKNVKLMMNR